MSLPACSSSQGRPGTARDDEDIQIEGAATPRRLDGPNTTVDRLDAFMQALPGRIAGTRLGSGH